jgi:6-aminohexanoate-oligomer exohydrolase
MTMADLSSLRFVNPHRGTGGAAGWTYRPVPATNPQPLPVAAIPLELDLEVVGAGRTWSLAEFHVETASTSLLVLLHGELVHEWYREGLAPTDLFLGASATKSLLSHLVGMAVRAGALELTDQVGEHVPELADSGYGRVPVGALVTMTSGVDWVEDHRDPVGPATALVSAFAAGGSSRAVLSRVGTRCAPGTRFEYCTADSQVLDWVRERATGVPFPEALQQLWADLGATADAVVAVDGDGVALAGGGVAAVATDWARIGLLQVHGALPDGRHLLDHDWVDDGSRPLFPFVTPGRLPSALSTHVGFGYHWWPLDELGARVSADGSRGQFVYVDRLDGAVGGVVIVKTSTWAYADPWHDRQCRDLSYLALATIADAARLSTREGVLQ